MTPPPKFSALPPYGLCGASPKAISGRTSYLRVRLEFLPYPRLITTLFNGCVFGPPSAFTQASAWTWVDHPVSGLHLLTCALFRLGFPSAPPLYGLTSPAAAARRTVLQKVRGPALAVPQLVNTGFQVLFHSPPGVLFTFPSQYSALSVTEEYLALRGGPRSFPLGFPCPVVLRIPAAVPLPSPTGLSPPLAALPRAVRLASLLLVRVLTPACCASRFGLLPFRSPLLRKSMFLSSPPAT